MAAFRTRRLARGIILAVALLGLLAAALALAPRYALAQDGSGGQGLMNFLVYTEFIKPEKPAGLRGEYTDLQDDTRFRYAHYYAKLNWTPNTPSSEDDVMCVFVVCWRYNADPTHYVVQRQQPDGQRHENGYPLAGAHGWTQIGEVRGSPPGGVYRDQQRGAPARNMEYRIQACNDIGCSAWSDAVSIRVVWPGTDWQ